MNDQLQACVSEQIFTGRYITTKAAAISILSIISFTFIVGNIRQHAHPLWTLAYIGDNLVVAYLPVMVIFTVISAIGNWTYSFKTIWIIITGKSLDILDCLSYHI